MTDRKHAAERKEALQNASFKPGNERVPATQA